MIRIAGGGMVVLAEDAEAAHTQCGGTVVEHLERSVRRGGDGDSFTFVDFRSDPDGRRVTYSWSELGTRIRAVAAQLQSIAEPGDRAAVLAGHGPDYVIAFFGAVHAGLVAVPLFSPEGPGHADRLRATLADCDPKVVLTGTEDAGAVRRFVDETLSSSRRPRLVAVDAVPDELATSWTPPRLDPADTAYLQYTSGSTRTPAGVVISHGAALRNVEQIVEAYELGETHAGVSWLPLFHDMGLVVFVLVPALSGIPATIMDPTAFIQRPMRWLRLLAERPGTFTAAPDFAYEHCVKRARAADLDGLRLDGVSVLINGAEPVRPATIEKFHEAFGPLGLSAATHRPSYGMAEATVFVSAPPRRSEPRIVALDRDLLAEGKAVAIDADDPRASKHASCGPAGGQTVIVVDPQSGAQCEEGSVGEVWLAGQNLGDGYFNKPKESAAVFGARLAEGSGPWLRTGDLAVLIDGEVYITGRLKDMIIVDGRNHYPHDVEATVADMHPSIRRGYVAAFSVPVEGSQREAMVVVAAAGGQDKTEIAGLIRRAVAEHHGVALHDLLLVPAGSVPRTSSGKIARQACRTRYLEGAFTTLGASA